MPEILSGQGEGAPITYFAQDLFGEPFSAENVITEFYAPLPDDLPALTRAIAEALDAGPHTHHELAEALDVTPDEKDQRAYGRDRQAEQRYQRYLEFVTLRALGCRVLAIKPANIDERLEELAGRLQL